MILSARRASWALPAAAILAAAIGSGGCTATMSSPAQQSAAPSRTAAAPAPQQTASRPAPVPLSEARVAFAPLAGPPQAVADRLAGAIARQSAAHGVALAPFGDPEADYTIKGYLSAETAGAGTRAIYVWDVLDRDLKRLHRVSGAVSAPTIAADPWTAIDPATLEEVARQSIEALAAWLAAG